MANFSIMDTLQTGRTSTDTTAWASTWITMYTNMYGCHAPNSTSIYMPMIMTKDHLYQKYSDALNAQHFTQAKLLSLTHFHKMFKGEHRHIKFPQFCILRQCNICASTNDTLTNQTMSTREQVQLKQWKLDHLKLVKAEQKAYHLHQQEAVADPSATLLIIMDGSTDVILPLLVPLPLAWKDLHLYKLGIHGFINHGLHRRSLYLHQGQFSCGLHPSTLYLQFDNCSWENKNKYMLAYCHWLVFNKVFQSITISFLPVGHTHEDIDQMFSTFMIGMKYNPQVLTVEAFKQGLQDWYSAPHLCPEPIFLLECWAIKSWLDPFSMVFREPPGLMSSASPVTKKISITILKDTLSALTELNKAQAMKKSYQDLSHWKCYT
ncbi:uncharacterized protein ACA1_377230 [Acanthamoeba castellanii str. Neff]|uniref:DUF7869 domain-containing protein n=1 Tax=Acanthamoeba castellanii (strain ATCC 30010 / Neff) TaxID=1257118 RepID=L8GR54_ACACF|nr:uncharacterized protein ACA1_377230 [Acanthamoeba castellanii str. Neff]ELR15619.1 hypothetical protein ACA1_377230 [Acanthamoeba castellanii str. Neff]